MANSRNARPSNRETIHVCHVVIRSEINNFEGSKASKRGNRASSRSLWVYLLMPALSDVLRDVRPRGPSRVTAGISRRVGRDVHVTPRPPAAFPLCPRFPRSSPPTSPLSFAPQPRTILMRPPPCDRLTQPRRLSIATTIFQHSIVLSFSIQGREDKGGGRSKLERATSVGWKPQRLR